MRNGSKKTILVVDDDIAFREVLKMALEPWGYEILLAEDGSDALQVFEATHPDLVLSDMVMPRLDGLGLLRTLKRNHPGSVVILFTAYATLANAIAAIREGAADMLTKPIDFVRLRTQLESLLENGGHNGHHGSHVDGNGSHKDTFSLPSDSGARPPESDFSMREQRPQGTFQNAGFSTLPGGRLSAPGPTRREH